MNFLEQGCSFETIGMGDDNIQRCRTGLTNPLNCVIGQKERVNLKAQQFQEAAYLFQIAAPERVV